MARCLCSHLSARILCLLRVSNLHHLRCLRTMTFSCLPNNTFPLPASIAPKLVALGLDEKTTAKVSRVYLSSALTLRGMLETEYLNACNALLAVSDSRGYSSKELRAKLLTVSITRYMQALSKCLDETIEKAEASLHRRDAQHIPQTKASLFH